LFLTTKMTEKCNLEVLDNDVRAATVYIAFLEPKIQQDAIELIYHKRNPGKNVQWVIDKRKELERDGYLTKSDRKLRGAVFKSNIDPIIHTIQKEIERSGSFLNKEDEFTKESFTALNLILNSTWFRNFYSRKILKNPFYYSNKKIHSTYQFFNRYIAGDILEVVNVKHLLLNLICEIGHYSYTYHKLMSLYPNIKFEDQDFYPDIQELLHVGSFDEYIHKKTPFIPIQVINLFYHDLMSNKDILVDIVNRKERYLLIERLSRGFELKNDNEVDEYALVRYNERLRPGMNLRRSYRSRNASMVKMARIIEPDYTHERELEIPKEFIQSIKTASALIPISVSNIMRKCYRDSSLAIEERCEILLTHYQQFFMECGNYLD